MEIINHSQRKRAKRSFLLMYFLSLFFVGLIVFLNAKKIPGEGKKDAKKELNSLQEKQTLYFKQLEALFFCNEKLENILKTQKMNANNQKAELNKKIEELTLEYKSLYTEFLSNNIQLKDDTFSILLNKIHTSIDSYKIELGSLYKDKATLLAKQVEQAKEVRNQNYKDTVDLVLESKEEEIKKIEAKHEQENRENQLNLAIEDCEREKRLIEERLRTKERIMSNNTQTILAKITELKNALSKGEKKNSKLVLKNEDKSTVETKIDEIRSEADYIRNNSN